MFIATTDIGQGDVLTANVVKLEQWPKDKIPPGAILRTEDIENRRTRTRLYAGEPILENRLFAKGANQQGAGAMIPVGYRVVLIKVDPNSGSNGLILPGDRVDIMIHLVSDQAKGIRETMTRTILQDVKVFAVNDVLDIEKDKDGGKSIAAKTISLLVTPQQAAIIMLASQTGVCNLVMRSPEDDKKGTDAEARMENLFGVAIGSHRDKEEPKDPSATKDPLVKAPVAVVAPPPVDIAKARTTWNMKIIKGAAVDEVSFEKDSNPDSASPTGPWKLSAPASSPPVKDDDVKATAPPLIGEPTDPAPPAQPPLPPILPPSKPVAPIKGK
jgi:pilus assembly protein CpaB